MPRKQPPEPRSAPAPRLLYVVTEDWAFLSHRLPMARAARDGGFEVHVATRVTDGAAAIQAERFMLHSIPFVRGSLSPLATFSTIAALRRVHRDTKPVLTHHVALQACVLGMIATLGRPVACVNAFIGLGYTFTSNARKARAVRRLIGVLLRFLVNRKNCVALVQNGDDMAALMSLGFPNRPADLRLCRPIARRQGSAHADCSASVAARTCSECSALDRGHAGSSKSSFDLGRGSRKLEQATWSCLPRPCPRYCWFLGEGACRRAAVAPGGLANVVDGSRGLRSCDDRERCARLSRNRYSRAHRPLVSCRRRAGAGRRNGSDRWRSPVTRALCHCRARASGREIRSRYNRTANCAAVSQSSRNRRNYTVEFHVSRLSLTIAALYLHTRLGAAVFGPI